MKRKIDKYFEAHHLVEEVEQILYGEKTDREDCDAMDELIKKNKFAANFINHITDEEHVKISCETIKTERNRKEQNVKLLSDKIMKHKKRERFLLLAKTCAASVAVLLISYGVWNFTSNDVYKAKQEQLSNVFLKSRSPILVLENGEEIELENKDVVADNYTVKPNGMIKYHSSDKIVKNRLVVPCQNTYSVILEDGTEIFLNGSSELLYPTKFDAKTREVQLKGEAYFKVAKSKIPFVVKVNDLSVRVYGTEFNINTNKSDRVETILVEGSVGVETPVGILMMKPNQMVTYNTKENDLQLTDIEVDHYLVWREGYLSYDMASLKDVLSDLSAWYGVKFIYHKDVDSIKIGMSVSRKRSIDELLKAIEEMADVRFVKEGGSIFIVE